MSVFADTAPELHGAGLNVVPVNVGTKKPPRGVRWKRWQGNRQTDADLDHLRRRFPNHSPAVVLGAPGLSIVDLETDSGEGETSLASSGLPIPETAVFRSPRGAHRIYRAPGPLSRCVGILPDVDALGSGYAIVPPTPGRRWERGLDHLADLPAEWQALLETQARGDDTSLLASCSALSSKALSSKSLEASNEISAVPLAQIFTDEAAVLRIAGVLGIPARLGSAFRCVLPGHGRAPGCPEITPSASLWCAPNGVWVYRDWHARSGEVFLPLPAVRASIAYGAVRRFGRPELATWGLRLLVEANILQPVRVDGPELPAWEAPHARAVYDGFRFLLGCKWLHTYGAPTAFSWRFAAAWCSVSQKQAGAAIQHLCYEGYLRPVERTGPVTIFSLGTRGRGIT